MRNIKCADCDNYRNEWCEKVIDSPYPDMLRDCQYFCERRDLVEVVRCKDCKWYSLGECENDNMWYMLEGDLSRVYCMRPKSNFYCGYGERRE